MATRRSAADTRPPGHASRAWTIFSLAGIAAWIAAIVIVSLNTDAASNSRAPERTAAVGGAVFFGVMFLAAGIGMRRARWQGTTALYDKLAIHEVNRDALKAANRSTSAIGYVYLAFGVTTTFIMLGAVWLGDDAITAQLLTVVIVLVVIWMAYMLYALQKVFVSSDVLFQPLGLTQTEMPTYVPNLFGSGGQLAGSMTYEGSRHGRRVPIVHTAAGSVTHLSGAIRATRAPATPNQMASLTGEPLRSWRGVSVQVESDELTVSRSGNGVGKWFLHDLLLAERIAESA